MKKRWSQSDYEYLEENWGSVSLPYIAAKLGRSENAIKTKVTQLGLGSYLDSGDYVTFNQLVTAVCGSNSGIGYKSKSWIENRGFPIHYKRVNQCRFKVVYLNEFWDWAEKKQIIY